MMLWLELLFMFLAGLGTSARSNCRCIDCENRRSMMGDVVQGSHSMAMADSEWEQPSGSWRELLWASPEVSSSSKDSIQRSLADGVSVTQCSVLPPIYPSNRMSYANRECLMGNQQPDLSMSQGCRLDTEGGAIPMTGPVCNGFIFVPCGMWYHRNPYYCGEAGTYPYFAAYGFVSHDVNGIPFLSWPKSANLRFWNDCCEPVVLERPFSEQSKANNYWPCLEAIDEAPIITRLDEESTGNCSGRETEQEQQPVSPVVGSQAVSNPTANAEDAYLKLEIEQEVGRFLSQFQAR